MAAKGNKSTLSPLPSSASALSILTLYVLVITRGTECSTLHQSSVF